MIGAATARFDSADFVTAFVDGGYEQGPRTDVAAVPEPGGVLLLFLGLVGMMRRTTTARNRVGRTVRSRGNSPPLRDNR